MDALLLGLLILLLREASDMHEGWDHGNLTELAEIYTARIKANVAGFFVGMETNVEKSHGMDKYMGFPQEYSCI